MSLLDLTLLMGLRSISSSEDAAINVGTVSRVARRADEGERRERWGGKEEEEGGREEEEAHTQGGGGGAEEGEREEKRERGRGRENPLRISGLEQRDRETLPCQPLSLQPQGRLPLAEGAGPGVTQRDSCRRRTASTPQQGGQCPSAKVIHYCQQLLAGD